MATKTIPVAAAKVAATLTNYPMLVQPSVMTGWGSLTLAEAQSIRFYSDSGLTTELAREVVSADEIHVLVPSLTTSTTIYADYDGIRSDYATTATYGAEAVWADYALVWHGESTTDSSGNTTLTANGGVSAGGVTGQIGDATTFDGSSDYYAVANTTELAQSGNVYLSAWARGTTNSLGPHLFGGYNQTYYNGYAIQLQANTQKFRLWDGNGWRASSVDVSTTTFQHLAARIDGSAWKLFHNGSSNTSGSGAGPSTNNNAMSIGGRGATLNDRTWDGDIDEMRVRRDVTNITDNWVTTEHNNQSDVASFFGTVTDAGGGGGVTPNNSARRLHLMSM